MIELSLPLFISAFGSVCVPCRRFVCGFCRLLSASRLPAFGVPLLWRRGLENRNTYFSQDAHAARSRWSTNNGNVKKTFQFDTPAFELNCQQVNCQRISEVFLVGGGRGSSVATAFFPQEGTEKTRVAFSVYILYYCIKNTPVQSEKIPLYRV